MDTLAKMREADLADLRWHWDSAYVISYEAGMFVAVRRDNGACVRRGEAEALHLEIAADYRAMPVPRATA
jgi:hypothetical protein